MTKISPKISLVNDQWPYASFYTATENELCIYVCTRVLACPHWSHSSIPEPKNQIHTMDCVCVWTLLTVLFSNLWDTQSAMQYTQCSNDWIVEAGITSVYGKIIQNKIKYHKIYYPWKFKLSCFQKSAKFYTQYFYVYKHYFELCVTSLLWL